MKVYLASFDFPASDMEWREIMYGSEEIKMDFPETEVTLEIKDS